MAKLTLSPSADELLKRVKKRYLGSRDFNGLHLKSSTPPDVVDAAIELARAKLVQVVSGSDYPNIHIRPWPSLRSDEDQIEDLRTLPAGGYGVALYPMTKALASVKLPKKYENRPFSRAMARGRGTLEAAFFSSDVLESYRNDARFQFGMGDFGISFCLSDEAYDEDHTGKDTVSLIHLGFAYDMTQFDSMDPESPIVRRVVAFHCDLKELTPEHQQRWASYQVNDDGIDPHPVWFNRQMGHWEEAVGPFERFRHELKSIKDLSENVWGEGLFRSHQTPEDFGWILRPDRREWDHFIHSLDKMLSENLCASALDKAGAPKENGAGDRAGTLARLGMLMTQNNVDPDAVSWALGPLREVRKARQRPAHVLGNNETDWTLVHKQMRLMHDVDEVLINIRHWLANHPRNRDWEDPLAGVTDHPI